MSAQATRTSSGSCAARRRHHSIAAAGLPRSLAVAASASSTAQ
ncbi:MAG TPA: hypothetical protein VNJ71_01440 [Gemmatimonadales bacterium]|nr:hypothetical protein [Gemmatimonadales bacterium]